MTTVRYKMNHVFRILVGYSVGAILALLTVWGVTTVFLDGLSVRVWDPPVSERVITPGYNMQSRAEG